MSRSPSLGARAVSRVPLTLAKPSSLYLGGQLCLDFVNTANWINCQPVNDWFISAEDIVRWSIDYGLTEADDVFEPNLDDFKRLRADIRATMKKWTNVAPDVLDRINQARATPPARFEAHGDDFAVVPDKYGLSLMRVLAGSTVTLALKAEPSRIKICDAANCGRMFLDDSPNNRRRWCSMATCGNREKARRFYRAHKTP